MIYSNDRIHNVKNGNVLYKRKNSVVQVDSIISISFFLLYIVWLFVFLINQNQSIGLGLSSSSSTLKTHSLINSIDSLSYSVDRLFLNIKGDFGFNRFSNIINNNLTPMVIELPNLDWQYNNTLLLQAQNRNNNVVFVSVPFLIVNNSLGFLFNTSYCQHGILQSNKVSCLFFLVHSNKSTHNFKNWFDQVPSVINHYTLGHNYNYITTQGFGLTTYKGLLRNLTITTNKNNMNNNNLLLKDFSVRINNELFTPMNYSVVDNLVNNSFITNLKSISSGITHECFVFASTKALLCSLEYDPTNTSNTIINLSFEVMNLSNYIINGVSGVINYSRSDCYSFTTNSIKLYDSRRNVALVLLFNKNINSSLCPGNESLILYSVTTPSTNKLYYYLLFDNSTNIDNLRYDFDYNFGVLESLTGLDYYLITNSTIMNALLGSKESVYLRINNGSNEDYSFGDQPSHYGNVFAKTFIRKVLMVNSSFYDGIITIRKWD